MANHLRRCPERLAAAADADEVSGRNTRLYHMTVRDRYNGDFWLHLEVNGLATLDDLDRYLRFIWLECCGHLSQFSTGKWWEDEISVEKRVGRVFEPGLELTHIYDFGTSSETQIKALSVRAGKPTTPNPIVLMARNDPPDRRCMDCDQPSVAWCAECVIEHDATGDLCSLHEESHPHDDYGEPLPIVNSPRTGLCGYDGPAEPPY